MFRLVEPEWGQKLLVVMNDFVRHHYLLKKIVPFAADVFVFFYPIYLVLVYLWGLYKRDDFYKEWALYIFFSWVLSIAMNLVIQFFVGKVRPEQLVLTKEDLIFEHVPDNPFPSDHTSLSSAIAMAAILWGIKTWNKFFIWSWIIFWIFSIIMWICRIAAWVHWPTDIIAGVLVWIWVSVILNRGPIFNLMQKFVYNPLIQLSKWIFKV